MKRTIKKQFWFNRKEAQDLQKKAKKACLCEADLVRYLLQGYEPKGEASELFYIALGNLGIVKEEVKEIIKELGREGSKVTPQVKKMLLALEKVEADLEESVLVPAKLEEKWR